MVKLLLISKSLQGFKSQMLSPTDLLLLVFYIGVAGVALGLIIATFIWL